MFSKCGAQLLTTVVVQITGVTGVIRWSGAVQVRYNNHIVRDMDKFALICLLTVFFPHHVSVLCREHQQTRLVVCYCVSPSAVSAWFIVVLL